MELVLASLALSYLTAVPWRRPTRCPHCPDDPNPHWICWGTYERYGEGSDRIHVQRYRCKRWGRTFSLLPDALLPFHHPTTATILRWMVEIFLEGSGSATVARIRDVARSTVRCVRAKFEKSLGVLRLPGEEGALSPRAFLERLGLLGPEGVAELFATWKEFEPKHSIVGVYPR